MSVAAPALPNSIELPIQYRSLVLPKGKTLVDPDTRELSFPFSSEAPTKRINWDIWDYCYEVLDHSPESANLERCNNGAAPLLWNHNSDALRGTTLKAWIEAAERRAWCTVRFSRSPEADRLIADINDGIVANVSFGYRNYELELTKVTEGDYNTYTSRNWEVFEVSFVAIPADPSVGVQRSDDRVVKNRVTLILPSGFGSSVVNSNRSEPMGALEDKGDLALVQRQLEERDRRIAELESENAGLKRRDLVSQRFSSLKEQARTLVDQRKLTTASYEELFGNGAFKKYLEEGSTELDQVAFHLKQVEKYEAPASFGPALSSGAIPAHPDQREERSLETPKADRYLEKNPPQRNY